MKSTVMNIDIAKPRVPGHEQFWSQCDVLDASGLKRAVSAFAPLTSFISPHALICTDKKCESTIRISMECPIC